MTDELTKALLEEDVASARGVAEAMHASATSGLPFVRALVETGAVSSEALSRVLSRVLATSATPVVERVVPHPELVRLLPPGLCERLHVVPVAQDATTRTVDIAMADVTDAHAASEVSFHLRSPVRPVRASLAAMTDGLRRLGGAPPSPPPMPPPPLTPRSFQRALLVVTDEDDDRASKPVPRHSHSLPPPPGAPVGGRRSRDTPPWGTAVPRGGSDAPRSGMGSDIPIPLTRRAFTAVSGGTQRPPPLRDPTVSPLGEGYDLDAEALQPVVEVDERREAPPSTEREADRLSTVMATLPASRAAVREATTRDEILDRLLASAEHVADRVALFVVRRGGYLGRSCNAAFASRESLEDVHLLHDEDNVFDRAVHEGPTLGPIPRDAAHAPLWAAMKEASPDVAIVPVRVKDKAVVILVADALVDTMVATRHLEEIATIAGEAFARLLRDR